MLIPPISRAEFTSPKLALVQSPSASPLGTWRPLADIVSGIVLEVQSKAADQAPVSGLPKAA